MSLTVGSLFSGIGGLDLGLERAGMRVIWQSEIDPYACRVLAKHWPEVPNYGDIKQIDWATVERPDVICGGYPCQPFSTAGKRRGTDDPRHLWPWVRNAISVLRPRFAILENVRGHLSMGGTVVIGDLAEIGYDAEWRVVSAAGLGAPHRRDRIIIVAYPDDHGSFTGTVAGGIETANGYAPERPDGSADVERRRRVLANANGSHAADGGKRADVPRQSGSRGNDRSGSGSDTGQISVGSSGQTASNVANTHRVRTQIPAEGRQPTEPVPGGHGTAGGFAPLANATGSNGRQPESHGLRTKIWETTKSGEQGRGTGTCGSWWETEPDVGRVANGVPSRVDRLRGLGNAVVPQVAEHIGRLVMAAA
jgi:DNA (cytosine-5)-methyltransferase 1